MEKHNFLSSIIHNSPNQEDKINFFVDCLTLNSQSLGMVNCNVNLNSKILCKLFFELCEAFSVKKKKYIKHHFEHYKNFISPDHYIVKEYYRDQFSELNTELANYISSTVKQPPQKLIHLLKTIIVELNTSYLENVVKELSSAILCEKTLEEHNHITIIENCANILISEFYSIGYPLTTMSNLFDLVIKYRFEDFDTGRESNIYEIPVPARIYELRNEPYEFYKNKVREYLSTSTLQNQFDNLIYLYNQTQKKQTYIFRVNNISLKDKDQIIITNNCTFSYTLKKHFPELYEHPIYEDFLKEKMNTMFVTVTIEHEHKTDALKRATLSVKEALNYINYNLSRDYKIDDRSLKAFLDASDYILITDKTASNQKRFAPRLKENHIEYIIENKNLEALASHAAVRQYLEIDKIFFEAFSSENVSLAHSNLWRYCEALFVEDSFTSEEIIDSLVNYYTANAIGEVDAGLVSMLYLYTGSYRRNKKCLDLGYTEQEFTGLIKSYFGKPYKEYIEFFNSLIKHPLINKVAAFNLTNTPDKIEAEISEHAYKIFKSLNVQRNLYQHSNIKIQEIENIWSDAALIFLSSFRIYVIRDLIANPKIEHFQKILPKVTRSGRI